MLLAELITLTAKRRAVWGEMIAERQPGLSFTVAAINGGELDVAFVRHNSAHPGAQRDVFPLLDPTRRTRVLGFTSTEGHRRANGLDPDLWTPDITDHYRFALSRVGLDGLLYSPTEPHHIAELAAAIERGPLSLEEEEHMIELAARATLATVD